MVCSVEVIPNTVDESSRFNVLDDGTLMIENTSDAEQGVYECVAKNSAGEAKTNAVEVKYQGDQGRQSEYLFPLVHKVLFFGGGIHGLSHCVMSSEGGWVWTIMFNAYD